MTAQTLEREETIEHLDPGDRVSCDGYGGLCPMRASWWMVCRGCNQHNALCSGCRLAISIVYAPGIECRLCAREGDLHYVVRFELIGGGC